jgi:hypothetical protein
LVFGNAFSVRCSIGRFLLEDFAPVCCLVGRDALENPLPIRGVIGRSRLGDSIFLFHAVKRLAALPRESYERTAAHAGKTLPGQPWERLASRAGFGQALLSHFLSCVAGRSTLGKFLPVRCALALRGLKVEAVR